MISHDKCATFARELLLLLLRELMVLIICMHCIAHCTRQTNELEERFLPPGSGHLGRPAGSERPCPESQTVAP